MGTTLQGTDPESIVRAAEAVGFKAASGVLGLHSYQEVQVPFIALCVNRMRGHFVVVMECNGDEVWICDPTHGVAKQSRASFEAVWNGTAVLLEPARNLAQRRAWLEALRQSWNTLNGYRLNAAAIAAISTVIAASALSAARLTQTIVDTTIGGATSIVALALAITALAAKCAAQYLRQRLVATLGSHIELRLGRNFVSHVVALPLRYIESRSTGDMLSRLADVSAIRHATVSVGLSMIPDICTLACVAIGLAIWASSTGIVIAVGAAVSALSVALGTRRIRAAQERARDRASRMIGRWAEVLSAMKTLKAFSATEREANAIVARHKEALVAQEEAAALAAGVHSAVAFVTGLAGVVVVLVSAKLIHLGAASPGQLVFYYVAAELVWTASDHIGQCISQIRLGEVSRQRLNAVMDVDQEGTYSVASASVVANHTPLSVPLLECDRIAFRYGPRWVLEDFSLSIFEGDVVALTGPSGIGKSTLAAIIAGVYEPDSGRVLVTGCPATLQSLRSLVSVVFQDALLVSGTIEDNIRIGDPNATDADVMRVADAAQVTDFAKSLPNGLAYQVGHLGSALSSGQRQRVSIARALLKRPKILLLDEATSNLDEVTERTVIESIHSVMNENAALIIVSHRMGPWRNVNKTVAVRRSRKVQVDLNYAESQV